jgi:hypothetical protein
MKYCCLASETQIPIMSVNFILQNETLIENNQSLVLTIYESNKQQKYCFLFRKMHDCENRWILSFFLSKITKIKDFQFLLLKPFQHQCNVAKSSNSL